MPAERRRNSRLRMQRELRGWSLEDVASGLHRVAASLGDPEPGADATMVSRWERGMRKPRPRYVRLLCRLFDLPADELGLVERADEPERSGSGFPAAMAGANGLDTELDDMERREFIRKLAATIGTVVIPPAVETLAPGPMAPAPWEALSRALRRQRGVDASALDDLEARTAGLHQIEMRIPARQLADTVAGHLNLLAHLLEFAPPAGLRRRLAAVAGETAVLAGWLAFDVHDHARARSYYHVALEAAKEAGDGPLMACVLGYLSYLHVAEGSLQEAVQLLVEAQSHAGGANPATRAWLAGREAEDRAAAGDADGAMQALERAHREFERAAPEDERSWTRFLDRSRFGSLTVCTYVRLGHAAAAQAAAEEAMEALPPSDFKKRSIILADVAGAYARQGDPDRACHLGTEALTIGLTTECRLGMRRLQELRRQLDPWRDAPVVRSLDEQLLAAGWPGV